MPETMKLLETTKSRIIKYKNGGNVPHLEITEVVLVHSNIVNKDYQEDLRVLYTFFHNKLFGELLDISPQNFIFSETIDSEFPYIKVWFTYHNSKSPDAEDKINITLVIS